MTVDEREARVMAMIEEQSHRTRAATQAALADAREALREHHRHAADGWLVGVWAALWGWREEQGKR